MRQILIMAIFLVQAFAASAQSNIEKVFKIVLNDPSTEVLSSSDYNVVCVDSGVSYCKFTEFTVPAKKKKLFAQIEKELLLAKSDAYNVFIKKPGSSSLTSNRLYDYGANNEYSVELGAHKSHVYYGLCFKDPADSMRRHAYLAVWFKDSRKYHCYYYHIYGVMPARFKEFKSGVRDALKSLNKGTSLRTQTVLDDNGVTTTTYDNDGNVRVFNSRSFSSATNNEVKTDIDFMLQFGNLRAAFLDAIKDADAKTLQTGIVVKIARLCREHSKLLTDNEKQTCISIIDEMKSTLKKVNPDTFMDGVLQEARIAVAK